MQASHLPEPLALPYDEKEAKSQILPLDSDLTIHLNANLDASDLICPISWTTMFVPRITNCGHHFEEDNIEKRLQTDLSCPLCQTPIISLSPSPLMETMLTIFYRQLKNQNEEVKSRAPISFDLVANYFYHQDTSLRERCRNIIEYVPAILNEYKEDDIHYSVAFYLVSDIEGLNFLIERNLLPHISESILNHVIQTGKFKGLSLAFILIDYVEPEILLQTKLPEKITSETLNAVTSEGQYQGESIALLLCSRVGRLKILTEAKLDQKLSRATLNKVVRKGESAGESVAFWLSSNEEGHAVMKKANLISQLSAEVLNAPIAEGTHKNESVAFNLTSSEAGLNMLIEAKRISLISSATLNRIVPEGKNKGKSVTLNLVKSAKSLEVLQESKLFGKINAVTLNAIIPEGPDAGKSVAFYLINSQKGRDLLNQHPNVKSKLSPENLKLLREIEYPSVKLPKEPKTAMDLTADEKEEKRKSGCFGKRRFGIFKQANEKDDALPAVKKARMTP